MLTDITIRNLPVPETGTKTYWDTKVKGLGVRVSSGGAKSFIVLIGSGRRQTIGRYPTIALSDARVAARRILAEKTLGRLRPTRKAYADARDEFLDECRRKNKPRTVSDYTRILTKHYPFGRTSVGDITTTDILRRLNKLKPTPAERRYAFVVGRTFFKWCLQQHYLERSPMENMSVPNGSTPRDRVLSDDELQAVYRHACRYQWPFGPIVALLILTGQRRGEIVALEWSWIAEDTITFPSHITKNRREHTFPIAENARAIIAGLPQFSRTYVFPAAREQTKGKPSTIFSGWSKAKAGFDAGLEHVAPYTIHDLRRSFSSGLSSLGIAPHVTERLLNHASGTVSGVAATYNRYHYLPEMRAAIDAWEVHLDS